MSTMKKRGFVTVATGHEKYYVMARNLLSSYKFHNPNPLPFAIICDRTNKYTSSFDDIVLLDNPTFSFRDKLRLVDLAPYDETIFIDADSLVCRCLDSLWDIVKGSPDFGIFGEVIDQDNPHFQTEVGRFRRSPWQVHFYCVSQGGMHFIRKSPSSGQFIQLCDSIVSRHSEIYEFEGLPGSDGVFPLACSIFNYPPVEKWYKIFCFYPESDIKRLDIPNGVVNYYWRPGAMSADNCFFVHFGARFTDDWPYKREAYRIRCFSEGKHPSIVAYAFIRSSVIYNKAAREIGQSGRKVKSFLSSVFKR